MVDKHPPKRTRGRPRTQSAEGPANTVQAFERGLSLLAALARDGASSLQDLALRVGLPPSTAHRLLVTAQTLGFTRYSEEEQRWSVGLEAFRVGSRYIERTNLAESARPALKHLMEDTGETANLGIADNGDVVFLSQFETDNPIRAFFRPGARGHMHASGIGKALLAQMSRADVERILHKKGLPEFTANTLTSPKQLFDELERIRETGWSLDDEERYLGMRCVAAPIYNSYGEIIAGISASGPTVRFADKAVAEIGPRVRRAAEEVTSEIGGRPPHQPNRLPEPR